MKHTHFVLICQGCSILLITALASGCAILSPVGNTISLGYENTVSYFNGYYNAKRLFSEAEEEIRIDSLSSRGKELPPGGRQVPGGAKQKLGQVIDKCSNLLTFHSTSSLVDNALLLVGKSFYCQMEYLKAERKFAELISQYPNSSLADEAQLWYARTEEKLGKFEEGVRQCEMMITHAHENKDRDIETQAHQLLASISLKMKNSEKAITELEKDIQLTNDDEMNAYLHVNLGDVYFSLGQHQKAAETFLQTSKYTSDVYLLYYSRLQASKALSKMGEFKKALDILNALIEDFRNREYMPSLYYERANNYNANEKRIEAVNDYTYVDTTYARTEYAYRSAFQLGYVFENKLGNYRTALKYYAEVNSTAGAISNPDGPRKYTALTRYFAAKEKLKAADSLLIIVSDTTRKRKSDTLAVGASDSVQRRAQQVAAPLVLPSLDSINSIKSIAAQELGDIFYSEVVVPDSAYYWYNKSLTWNYDHSRSPRILYILAELARTNPEKKFPSPQEYFNRLDHDFPGSLYTEEGRRLLGRASSRIKVDTAATYYEQAEKQIDARQYRKALETLRFITQKFLSSPYASQSAYTIGWIFENLLAQPDSALIQYRSVIKNYAGTTYAAAAAQRSDYAVLIESARKDSVSRSDSSKVKNILSQPAPAAGQGGLKNPLPLIKDNTRDSIGVQKTIVKPKDLQKRDLD